jgi:hypothetical protein
LSEGAVSFQFSLSASVRMPANDAIRNAIENKRNRAIDF